MLGRLLKRGVYLKMPISEGRLLDTRRLLESVCLNDRVRCTNFLFIIILQIDGNFRPKEMVRVIF